MKARAPFLKDVLSTGYDFVFMDSDSIMLRDPLPYLFDLTRSGNADIQFAQG